MKRVTWIWLVLAAMPLPACAYSLLWLDPPRVTMGGWAWAYGPGSNDVFGRGKVTSTDTGLPMSFWFGANNHDSFTYGRGGGNAVESSAFAWSSSDSCCEDFEWGAEALTGFNYERRFSIAGGKGLVDVEIPVLVTASSGFEWTSGAEAGWSVAVGGFKSIGDQYYDTFDVFQEEHDWSGRLAFGRAYTLRASGWAYTVDFNGTSSDSDISLDFGSSPAPRGTSPVPEPGTWALVAVGLFTLGITRQRRHTR